MKFGHSGREMKFSFLHIKQSTRIHKKKAKCLNNWSCDLSVGCRLVLWCQNVKWRGYKLWLNQNSLALVIFVVSDFVQTACYAISIEPVNSLTSAVILSHQISVLQVQSEIYSLLLRVFQRVRDAIYRDFDQVLIWWVSPFGPDEGETSLIFTWGGQSRSIRLFLKQTDVLVAVAGSWDSSGGRYGFAIFPPTITRWKGRGCRVTAASTGLAWER